MAKTTLQCHSILVITRSEGVCAEALSYGGVAIEGRGIM
jgi:hypothetical protein